jgi:hypothetical protein
VNFRLRPDGRVQLSERDVTKACLDALRWRKYYPVRQPVGLHKTWDDRPVSFNVRGDADYAVMHAVYRPLWLEFKRPGKRARKEQRERHEQLLSFYGIRTVVIASLDELLAWLEQHEQSGLDRRHQ